MGMLSKLSLASTSSDLVMDSESARHNTVLRLSHVLPYDTSRRGRHNNEKADLLVFNGTFLLPEPPSMTAGSSSVALAEFLPPIGLRRESIGSAFSHILVIRSRWGDGFATTLIRCSLRIQIKRKTPLNGGERRSHAFSRVCPNAKYRKRLGQVVHGQVSVPTSGSDRDGGPRVQTCR